MSAELLVNITPRETRVALIENGMLQEIFVERERSRGIVGNIYNCLLYTSDAADE